MARGTSSFGFYVDLQNPCPARIALESLDSALHLYDGLGEGARNVHVEVGVVARARRERGRTVHQRELGRISGSGLGAGQAWGTRVLRSFSSAPSLSHRLRSAAESIVAESIGIRPCRERDTDDQYQDSDSPPRVTRGLNLHSCS